MLISSNCSIITMYCHYEEITEIRLIYNKGNVSQFLTHVQKACLFEDVIHRF